MSFFVSRETMKNSLEILWIMVKYREYMTRIVRRVDIDESYLFRRCKR